jgi:hypothetical protein
VKGVNWQYKIPKNSEQINLFKEEANTIVVIPAIEGAHSLVSGNAQQLINGPVVHQSTLQNIQEVKQWEHPPLYVTLSHHFYNGMVGQARSIPDGAPSFLLKQQVGLNEPVNERGEEVIDCLLGINKFNGNGRRILIDIKHMSVTARLWYYKKIKQYNAKKSEEDKIPIIASHMGYGNYPTLLKSIEVPDNNPEKYKDSDQFNPWSINLSDEEIVAIIDSNGIIGLNLDQRILSGDQVINQSKEFSRSDIRNNRSNVVEFWTKQFARNLLGIVEAVIHSGSIDEAKRKNVWNQISLGTDFDGLINPVDAFIVSDEIKNLREALKQYLPDMPNFEELAQGLGIEEILDKILYNNVLDFVVNNYK